MDPRFRWPPAKGYRAHWIGATEHCDIYGHYPEGEVYVRWGARSTMLLPTVLCGEQYERDISKEEREQVQMILDLFAPRREEP